MNQRVFNNNYEDLIGLAHHVSPTRNRMSMLDRAAQFSPFAALTGHDAAILETARLTESKIELDENEKTILNEKLQIIAEKISELPEVTITYFQPDQKKSGGEYAEVTGKVKKIDEYERCVRMVDGAEISIDLIYKIHGNLFKE